MADNYTGGGGQRQRAGGYGEGGLASSAGSGRKKKKRITAEAQRHRGGENNRRNSRGPSLNIRGPNGPTAHSRAVSVLANPRYDALLFRSPDRGDGEPGIFRGLAIAPLGLCFY
jgi:hypothetical protein